MFFFFFFFVSLHAMSASLLVRLTVLQSSNLHASTDLHGCTNLPDRTTPVQ